MNSGVEVETTDDERLMSIPADGKRGRVFINGALATEDGDFLFDYNFQDDKLCAIGLKHVAADLKDGQNRDREAIGISVVEEAVAEVILNLSDPDLIRHMLTAWMNGSSKRREYRLNRLRVASDFVPIWKQVAQEVWPGKVCQPPRHGYRFDDDDDGEDVYGSKETESLLAVQDNGYTTLPGNMPWGLQKIVFPLFPTVNRALGLVAKTPQDKVMQTIPRREWMADEVRIIGETVKSRGIFPGLGSNPDEHLRNILTNGELTITIEDNQTGAILYQVEGVRIAERDVSISARGIAGENVSMVAIRCRDEADLT
jgi:hypothetical protein